MAAASGARPLAAEAAFVVYKGCPDEGCCDAVRWRASSAECGIVSAEGVVLPAAVAVRAARVEVAPDAGGLAATAAARSFCLVPTLVVQRRAATAILLRGTGETEMELRLGSSKLADELEAAVRAAAADVVASLFAPLLAGRGPRLAPPTSAASLSPVVASACLVYSATVRQAPCYGLRFAELGDHGFAYEVFVYSSPERSETLAAIILTRATVLHVLGSCNVFVKERHDHHFAFPTASVAKAWADLLQSAAVAAPGTRDPAVHQKARHAEAVAEACLGARSNNTQPLLALAELPDGAEEEEEDSDPLRQANSGGVLSIGFDIAALLAGDDGSLNSSALPQSSDTCVVLSGSSVVAMPCKAGSKSQRTNDGANDATVLLR